MHPDPEQSMQLHKVTFEDHVYGALLASIIQDIRVLDNFDEHGQGQQVGFRDTCGQLIAAYT